jgi:putative ABC transport system substrate-binding protein
MDRRTFIGACAGGLVLARPSAEAQSAAKRHRVGFLSYTTAAQAAHLLREFDAGLRERGYADGRNIVIEPHYGDGTMSRLSDLAEGMVQSRVDIIVTGSNPIAAAAKRATTSIPIVMVGTLDPVGFGLVASLARPGGNVTGLCVDASTEMSSKMLGLLTEIVPGVSRIGLLRQVGYADAPLEAAARRLNVELSIADVRTMDEIEGAFVGMLRRRVGAIVVRGSLFYVRRQQVADLALKHRLPAIHALRE